MSSRTLRLAPLAFMMFAASVLPVRAGGQDSAAAGPPEAPNRTVWDGVFNEIQLERGREAFSASCSGCHANDLSGGNGPALKGEFFIDRWRQFELATLFQVVRENMPPPRVRSSSRALDEQAYLDILAYILEGNRFPAGGDELTADALDQITIIAEGGPLPLPSNSLVRVVGCLAEEADGSWLLVRATEPVRAAYESIDTATEEELARSAAADWGTQTFRLANLDYLGAGHSPAMDAGKRMQAKGTLIRQPNRERINVTSLEVAAEGCR